VLVLATDEIDSGIKINNRKLLSWKREYCKEGEGNITKKNDMVSLLETRK